jgi:CRP-like cAMP-binding protein
MTRPSEEHKLSEILNKYGINDSHSVNEFLSRSSIQIYSRNTLLFRENQKNTSEYIIIKGIAHRHNISVDGEPVTTGFFFNGSVVTPHFARTVKNQSIFSLEAITELVAAEIPVTAMDYLRYNNDAFMKFGQLVLERELTENLQNQIAFRSVTARIRLQILRKRFPELENHVPHHIIASYLGITNVSFSRLRRDLL